MKEKRAADRKKHAPADERLFKRTVKRLLGTPPMPHDEMKMGAARKRDTRSSGKGAKGQAGK